MVNNSLSPAYGPILIVGPPVKADYVTSPQSTNNGPIQASIVLDQGAQLANRLKFVRVRIPFTLETPGAMMKRTETDNGFTSPELFTPDVNSAQEMALAREVLPGQAVFVKETSNNEMLFQPLRSREPVKAINKDGTVVGSEKKMSTTQGQRYKYGKAPEELAETRVRVGVARESTVRACTQKDIEVMEELLETVQTWVLSNFDQDYNYLRDSLAVNDADDAAIVRAVTLGREGVAALRREQMLTFLLAHHRVRKSVVDGNAPSNDPKEGDVKLPLEYLGEYEAARLASKIVTAAFCDA